MFANVNYSFWKVTLFTFLLLFIPTPCFVQEATIPGEYCKPCQSGTHSCVGITPVGGVPDGYACRKPTDSTCGSCEALAIITPPPSILDNGTVINLFKADIIFNYVNLSYAALSISKGPKMRDMYILYCQMQGEPNLPNPNQTDPPFAGVAYSMGTKMPSIATTVPPTIVGGVNVSSTHTIMECTFFFENKLKVQSVGKILQMDFVNEKYYVGFAIALCKEQGLCVHHTSSSSFRGIKFISSRKVMIIEKGLELTGVEMMTTLYKLHGGLMALTFLFLIPTATNIARFFRETWSTYQWNNKRIWYNLHVGILLAGVLCIFLSYISIMGYGNFRGVWHVQGNTKSEIHGTIGFVCMGLYSSQSILHFAIPARFMKVRKIYSKIHWVVGTVTYILGFANIMLTPVLLPWAVGCHISLIVTLWVSFHFGVYMAFSHWLFIQDHEMVQNRNRWRALTSYPMRLQSMAEAPGRKLRIIFLQGLIGINTFMLFIFVIVLSQEKQCNPWNS